jgi:hypothetical protein
MPDQVEVSGHAEMDARQWSPVRWIDRDNGFSTTGAKACFQAYGDKVWVKDTKANGDSAAGTISDTETSMSWHRECFNNAWR